MKKNILLLLLFMANAVIICSQTVLNPGDLAIIGIKTNTSTQSGNDAIKLLTLVELACDTKFIVTDNNWNSAGNTWFCNDDEFAVELTVTSTILAGSNIFIDVESSGGSATTSTGALSKVALTSGALDWGSNFGLNSGGDNVFVLQGTRAVPRFVYALRHNGTFASGGDCSTGGTPRNNTGLPATLSLGSSAIQMASSQDQWHYNCGSATTSLYINNRVNLLTSISNNTNWTSATGQQWNNSSCSFNILDASFNPSGSIGVAGAGCGCIAGCNLTSLEGPNCAAGVAGNCTAGAQTMFADINVPVGCTYRVYATMRNWTACTASGVDGGDQVKVDIVGGAKGFVSGANNTTANDNFTLVGPGTIRVSGTANRADEIIVYRVLPSTCSGCPIILPIELLDFSVFAQENSVLITWATASEENTDLFQIEKSSDGISFEVIETTDAVGNSTQRNNYEFRDNYPVNGYNYYRIKSIDIDGSSSLSATNVVSFERDEVVKIFPNPLSQNRTLNIVSNQQFDRINILNFLGQTVMSISNPANSIELPSDLGAGFYTVLLERGNQKVVRKLAIE